MYEEVDGPLSGGRNLSPFIPYLAQPEALSIARPSEKEVGRLESWFTYGMQVFDLSPNGMAVADPCRMYFEPSNAAMQRRKKSHPKEIGNVEDYK